VIVAAVVMSGAFGILSMVVKQNRYATRVVEIQDEQKIIDTGIYSLVRHPMYMAFTFLFMVSPLVLGSLYSLLPALCFPFLMAFRIKKEEEVLCAGLAGYDLYRKKVKYRLIPFIW
jgi:protein-S-isoprenylcysteine O-methyltransferase Ste14